LLRPPGTDNAEPVHGFNRSVTALKRVYHSLSISGRHGIASDEVPKSSATSCGLAGEFLGLVGYKESGMVIKLPRARVEELINERIGLPFAPAGKVFREWVAIPKPDGRRWTKLLLESVAFVA
jgi:hypothetical protein